MNTNDAVTSLIAGLHDEREGLRQYAMRRLVNLGSQTIPALIDTLGDNKEYTQESAAIALTTFGATALPHLLDAMKNHGDRRVRWGAAWVLASLGSEVRGAVPPVAVPAGEAEAKPVPERRPSDIWSDSWLTKIREQLNAARQLDLKNLSNAQC